MLAARVIYITFFFSGIVSEIVKSNGKYYLYCYLPALYFIMEREGVSIGGE